MRIFWSILFISLFISGCKEDDTSEVIINLNKDLEMTILPGLKSENPACIVGSNIDNCIDLSISSQIRNKGIEIFLTDIQQSEQDLTCRSHVYHELSKNLEGEYKITVSIDQVVIDTGRVVFSDNSTRFNVPNARLVNFISVDYQPIPEDLVFGRLTFTDSEELYRPILDSIQRRVDPLGETNIDYGYLEIQNGRPLINFGAKKDYNHLVFAGLTSTENQREELIEFLRRQESDMLQVELYGYRIKF